MTKLKKFRKYENNFEIKDVQIVLKIQYQLYIKISSANSMYLTKYRTNFKNQKKRS